MISSGEHGWKKQCLMFEKHTSTVWPLLVENLTPLRWIVKLPTVFLPKRLGLMTRPSSTSLLCPRDMVSNFSRASSELFYLASEAASKFFACFYNSLMFFNAVESLLLGPVWDAFRTIWFIIRLLGSSMGGNVIWLPTLDAVWKLILKKVHWPCCYSDTLLIVEMCKGTKVVGLLGTKTQCLFMST